VAATSQSSGAHAYAQALFEASEAQGGLAAAGEAGDAVAALGKAWRTDRRLRGFFLSGEVGLAERQAAAERLASTLPGLVPNFVRMLSRRGRLDLMPDIADAMTAILHQRLHRVPVTLATAVEMPPERLARWAQTLKDAIGLEPVIKNVVRPELVAGAVVRVGDVVADGSARRKLNELRRSIVERAVT
jgi:F-type H+-transporting ATPase subunit delta